MLAQLLCLLLAASAAGTDGSLADGEPVVEHPDERAKADGKPADGTADPDGRKRVTENVVVTATRMERTASDLPVSASVVSGETIRETPARTVDDLVRTIPGLNLPLVSSRVTYPTNQTFSMRGVGPNRGLVLLDGVPINDAFLSAAQWQKVPLGSVERVEVVRGGGSSLFGNLAMGGTLQLVTRRIEKSGYGVDLSYGSYASVNGAAHVEQRLGPDVAVGLSVDGYHSDGYVRSVPEDRTPLDEPYANKGLDVQLRADLGQASTAHGFVKANVLANRLSQGTPLGFNNRRITDVVAGGTLPAGALGELSATLFYQDQRFEVHNASFRSGTGNSVEYLLNSRESPIHDTGGSLQWSRGFAGIVPTVTAGVDVRRIDGEDRGHEFEQSGRETVYRISGGKQRFVGFFVEASVLPTTSLEVLASARVDTWLSFSGQTISTPGQRVEYQDVTRATFDPRLSLRYRLTEGLSARGAAYRGFRAPTLQDLYRYNLTRSQQVVPNPSLGAETMVGGELGLELSRGPVSAQLNLFQNQVDDQVVRVQISKTPVSTLQPQNVAVSRSRGFEAFGELALSARVAFQAGYTFTDAVLTDNPPDRSVEGNQVPDLSRHFGSAALQYHHSSGLLASLRWRAWSRRYPDASNATVLPGAAVLDALLSYPALPGLDVTVSAENILDRRYIVEVVSVGRRIGEPFQIFFGVRWQPGRGTP